LKSQISNLRLRWPLTLTLSPEYRGEGIGAVQLAALLIVTCNFVFAPGAPAAETAAKGKPVPRAQVIPQPYDQVSFQREGTEIARYHFGNELRRPFVFPLVGPSGRSVTRMGHPRDPETHSHHNSVWVSHNSVNGVSFWDDRSHGRIVHQRVEKLEDEGGDVAAVVTANDWVDESSGTVLLKERRRTEVRLLDGGEWMLIIDLQLEPGGAAPVTFGKTPFGLLGVRMAKTIGVHDGGGTIRNSEGGVDEKRVLWKRAKWVDYSGPIAPNAVEGVTLMDHPANPNHPAFFHVRDDGWMGTSLTYDTERTIEPAKPLKLRYGLYVHAGALEPERLNRRWEEFASLEGGPGR